MITARPTCAGRSAVGRGARRLVLLLAVTALLSAWTGSHDLPAASAWQSSAGTGEQGQPPRIITTFDGWQVADPSFTALPGAQAYAGILDRSAYRIEVPDNWNGELVMWAHGYAGEARVLQVSPPALRRHLVAAGFAWAASSYEQNGYVPDLGVRDTLELRDFFIERWGMPVHTYLDGASMGGHIVVASLEQHPEVYDGALAECGALMQAQELDYLTAYFALGDALSGAFALPADRSALADALKTKIIPGLGPPDRPTAAGLAFESAIANLTGGPRPFRHEGFVHFFLSGFTTPLLVSEDAPASQAATDDYFTFHADPAAGIDDARLNASVYRKPANPLVRNVVMNPTFALPTGRITVPLMTYHTTGDDFVPALNEINYRRLVDSAGAGDLLVQRAVRAPDHCQFADDDLAQGFDDLVAWVESGVHPEGDDYLAPDLTGLGRHWTHHVLSGDDQGY